MKILIVEDEKLLRKALAIVLEKQGFEVDQTGSGKEAILLIKKNNYDKILCDLMLNDLSGFDIIEEVKTSLTKDEIQKKVIVMTAYSSHVIESRVENLGLNLLKKPFSNFDIVIGQLNSTVCHS